MRSFLSAFIGVSLAIFVLKVVDSGYIRYDYAGLHIGPPPWVSHVCGQGDCSVANPLDGQWESQIPFTIPRARPKVYISPSPTQSLVEDKPCDNPEHFNNKRLFPGADYCT